MDLEKVTLVMLPQEELADLLSAQQEILQQLKELNTRGPTGVPIKHITAIEFMKSVRIKRTKFDTLVQANKIKIIKKRRKIYVPISEVERYFNDPEIQ
jgi:hypothetical protein